MKSNDEIKKKILESVQDYDINEFLAYRKLPISKKLDFLEQASEFFDKFTPLENKRAWEILKERGL